MIEIIPAILVKTEREFRERLAAVEALVPWVQLDIVDGIFAPNRTWGDPAIVASLATPIRFEIDLMVEDDEAAVRSWLGARQVGRIFFHEESSGAKARALIELIRATGKEVGMSLNPKTSHEKLYPFAGELDGVLFLGVEPGFGGQTFIPSVREKVRLFHERFPNVPITVDGGVNPENAAAIVAAGATRLAAGSFIFRHPRGPEVAIAELWSAITESSGNQ